MVDTNAQFAKPFSGLAENLKFVSNVPNGSVWRELDTHALYFYNESDETWYDFKSKVVLTDIDGNAISSSVDDSGDYHLNVAVTESNEVPLNYTKMTASGIHKTVQKGQANEYIVRPQILNEHSELHSDTVGEVNATTIVGQVFKASQDNINSFMIPLESAEATVFDTFETYENSTALQTAWVEDTNAATLETTIVSSDRSSTKSMKLPCDTEGDTWTKTIEAADFTGYNGVFDFYQDKEFDKLKLSVVLGDGVNTISLQLVVPDKNEWTHFDIPISALSEDGGGTTDITAITKVSFRVDDKEGGKFAYVDNYYATPPPGEVELKLWDFGATLPTETTTLDDATQYTELGDRANATVASSVIVSLVGGKRQYHIHDFVAGVAKEDSANTLLTGNNYYGITLHYVDTEVNVYGNGSTNYTNGFAFSTPDTSTGITDLEKDLGFAVFSTQPVYVTRIMWNLHNSAHTSAAPGHDAAVMIVIAGISSEVTDVIMTHIFPPSAMDRDLALKPYPMVDGGKIKVYYEDDYSDNVGDLIVNAQYYYIPNTPNG